MLELNYALEHIMKGINETITEYGFRPEYPNGVFPPELPIEKNGDNVFVIGSTNRVEDIDPAVLRSGRFGLTLTVNPPDLEGTKHILDIHTKGKRIDRKVDKNAIAEKMYKKQMTGADIAEMVTKAFSHALERSGIYASMESGRFSPQQLDYFSIKTEDFEKAIDSFKNNVKKRNPIGFQQGKK